jgi:hypothetical protein
MAQYTAPDLRTIACDLAASDTERAVHYAHQIDDPWYACQAFSYCARYGPEADFDRFIQLAFDRAASAADEYQKLAVTAWPLRALIERYRSEYAKEHFRQLKNMASRVEPLASRAEACFHVWQAVGVNDALSHEAFPWVLANCHPIRHWRQERAVRRAVIQAITYLGFSRSEAIQHVKNRGVIEKIQQRLAQGETDCLRGFYWPRPISMSVFSRCFDETLLHSRRLAPLLLNRFHLRHQRNPAQHHRTAHGPVRGAVSLSR